MIMILCQISSKNASTFAPLSCCLHLSTIFRFFILFYFYHKTQKEASIKANSLKHFVLIYLNAVSALP